MAMLIFGLGGFGVTNLSGNIRTIGHVGEKEITTGAYARALQNELRAREAEAGAPIPFSAALNAELDKLVLARLIATAALDDEAARLGLSVGDENLRGQLLQVQQFSGLDGEFDRDAYKFYLDRSGQSEKEFEEGIRDETARGLLQAAVLAGIPGSDTYANTLLTYLAERRSFTWASLNENDLTTPLPEPTEAELSAFHSANAALFTLPETKQLTYVWLTPDMLLDEVEVDDAALRAQYESRSAEFNQPERRLVERLVFPDEAAAETAKVAIETNAQSFDDAVADRGLDLADVDLGDVLQSDLGEAGSAVFNTDPGGVVGPFNTDLGPALFRVNGVLPARSMTFDEARPELRDELAADRARRVIDTQSNDIDDLLAAGATLEELARETDMQLATVDWTPDASNGAAGYTAFQEAAGLAQEGDFPALIRLDDGGLAALRLDAVLPPRLQPLDDVRDDVAAAWSETEVARRLGEQANALLPQISAESDMAALGLTVTQETDITRGGFVPGTAPEFLKTVFDMEPGTARLVAQPGGALIVRLDAIAPPDANDPEVTGIRDALSQQSSSGQAQDLYQYFVSDVQARAGLRLDQRAINAVNANFQ